MKVASCSAFIAPILALNVGSVSAADLGGNCCADLEERVAELDAMTAYKGTRKMSLTVFGEVTRVILHWDDSHSSNTYYGLEASNYQSRFGFRGQARISPSLKMGFEIAINQSGANSGRVSQLDEDGRVGAEIVGSIGPGAPLNAPNVDSYFAARRLASWIEHTDLGRLTVGRWNLPGVWGIIDITENLYAVASPGFGLLNGAFFIRGPSGQYYAMVWGNISDPAAGFARTELVRYDSPVWHGFMFSSGISEDGGYWGSMLRYAGEHGGFRVAGQVGYEKVHDRFTPATLDPTAVQFTSRLPDVTPWGYALSAKHLATGLFAQGQYSHVDYGVPGQQGFSGYWGQSTNNTQKPADLWLIQFGVSKDWFGFGDMSVYGEYGKAINAAAADTGRNFSGNPGAAGCPGPNALCSPLIANFITVNGVIGSELTVSGFGVSQTLSAASAIIFVGYRHFDADIVCTGAVTASGACAGAAGGPAKRLPTNGLDVTVIGSRVSF